MTRNIFTIARLEKIARKRLPGYLEACKACGKPVDGGLEFDENCRRELSKYRLPRPSKVDTTNWPSVEAIRTELRRGGCCDPPKAV